MQRAPSLNSAAFCLRHDAHLDVHGELEAAPPSRPPALPIRRRPVRRGAAPPSRGSPGGITSAAAVRWEALLRVVVAAVELGALWTAKNVQIGGSVAIDAVDLAPRELANDQGQLLLQHLDALLHDGIGLERADRLKVKVKARGLGLVVKRLVLSGRLFPVGVPAPGPD